MRAWVAGATGLSGGYCLQALLKSDLYQEIVVLCRETFAHADSRVRVHQLNFETLADWRDTQPVDDIFCCLGTSMRHLHDRPSLDRVDFEYPLTLARLGLAQDAKRLFIITSSGIGLHSPIYYCRVKARLESALAEMTFVGVRVMRPSFLIDRPARQDRFQYWVGRCLRPLTPLFRGPLGPYRPVPARAVGAAMAALAQTDCPGFELVDSLRIERLGRAFWDESSTT